MVVVIAAAAAAIVVVDVVVVIDDSGVVVVGVVVHVNLKLFTLLKNNGICGSVCITSESEIESECEFELPQTAFCRFVVLQRKRTRDLTYMKRMKCMKYV